MFVAYSKLHITLMTLCKSSSAHLGEKKGKKEYLRLYRFFSKKWSDLGKRPEKNSNNVGFSPSIQRNNWNEVPSYAQVFKKDT